MSALRILLAVNPTTSVINPGLFKGGTWLFRGIILINTALKTVALFLLVAGLAYEFVRTCLKVYKSTSPTKALFTVVKRIIIDCTRSVIKYPLFMRELLLVVKLSVS